MKKIQLFIMAIITMGIVSCAGGDLEFQETESGLKYVFHEQSGNERAEMGKMLSMHMSYSVNDSVIFNSTDMDMPVYIPLEPSGYPGDIFEAMGMLAVGDSASFKLNARDFFVGTAGMIEPPPFVGAGDDMLFHIRLIAAFNEEEFAMEEQRIMEEQMKKNLLRAEQEDDNLLAYVREEGIEVEPTASGLYFIEHERGDGRKVESGDLVSVHYEGRLLDGTVFDASHDRGEPLEFIVGQGWVIPGWDEGINLMHVGGKATLIIPSYLGYGDRADIPVIPPYSTLIFDVEVVDAQDPQ